jgi:enoyl-CoA hydratase/carnithine racemase
MPDPILFDQNGAIATLTLNLPAARNPISEPSVVEALITALARAQSDTSVRVLILTGAGSAFSSGGDIRAMADAIEHRRASPADTTRYYRAGIQRIPLAFERLDVPVIAAVNGAAVGAGLDLTCMCDMRIAAEGARFAESFVRMGIIAGDGGAWLLPRAVGYAKAAEMAFTGAMIDAAEALRIGLVSRVVPDAELMDSARDLAARIAANPPQAVRMTKRLMLEARNVRLDTSLEMAAVMQALMHATPDHREAVMAFLEKRTPNFG